MAVLIIPALNPDNKLIRLVEELVEMGFDKIVIVDDGSDEESEPFFEIAQEYGCRVFYHDKNYGKGMAIKTAIRKAIEIYGRDNSFITLDADGQHLPSDVKKVAEACMYSKGKLILGKRSLNDVKVPLRSRFGNKVTSIYFKFETGIRCDDTQTGLRGIPPKLVDLALSTPGERYEYEMNFLMEAAKIAEFRYVEINTVYENNNSCSHFRPLKDSYRIYARPLKYAAFSLLSSLADYIIFLTMLLILNNSSVRNIFIATVMARISSGTINFFLNRNFIFDSRGTAGGDLIRYAELFTVQMCTSAVMVAGLSKIGVINAIGKPIVDTILFFVSYKLQKEWVFRKRSYNTPNYGDTKGLDEISTQIQRIPYSRQ